LLQANSHSLAPLFQKTQASKSMGSTLELVLYRVLRSFLV
jgi:hypothetical protein